MADLIADLKSAAGADHVGTEGDLTAFAVDGLAPRAVVEPGSVEEVSAALKACHAARAAVVPWGGGTSMALGARPQRVDVILRTHRLNQVLEHEPGDMTSTVQAGMVFGAYQEYLGRRGQWLALDPPAADRATIGGILAANVSGPRRVRYGAARDQLIGGRIVHADGTVTKFGAKVVKNVTGYDMNKLYVGSLGTLGVLVETTFRLYPLPAAEETWTVGFPTAAMAREAVARILDSPLMPSALEILNGAAAREAVSRAGVDLGPGAAVLAAAVASVPEAVAAQIQAIQGICREAGGTGGEALRGPAHDGFWEEVRNLAPGPGVGMVCRASVLLSRAGDAVWQGEAAAAQQGLQVAIAAGAGTGLVRYCFHAEGGGADRFARLAAAVQALRNFAADAKGHLVVLAAPAEVKERVDVWGPAGDGFPLMRGLKDQFDPDRVLNPGRFVGGL